MTFDPTDEEEEEEVETPTEGEEQEVCPSHRPHP